MFISMDSLLRLLHHGEQDLQLLRFNRPDLLGVLVDRGGLNLLRQFPEIRREFQALDVAPVWPMS